MDTDIANNMINEMGLTPQMADHLQNQQGNMGMGMGQGGMGQGGMGQGGMGGQGGLPTTPEEQMRLMAQAQQPMQQQMPPQQPMQEYASSESSSESTTSTESEINLGKAGLGGQPKSMMDNIMDYLKDPLIIMVLFVILSLAPVGDALKRLLPFMITSNVHYMLGVKALIMGVTFLAGKLVIT